jgi:hypothetical protein
MPNWCSNNLVIRGSVETLSQLKPVLEAGEGLLEAIKPIGEWQYGDAVEAWGTKWDISTEGLQFTDNGDGTAEIEGYFDSAWSPPVEAFAQLAEDWDSCYIELKYFEPGMAFVGEWNSEGLNDEYEIDTDDIGGLPEHIREEWNIEDWFDTDEDEE